MLKILELSEIGNNGHIGDDVVSIVVSTISSYISGDICESISGRYQIGKRVEKFEELHNVFNKARKELTDVYRGFKQKNEIEFSECSPEGHYFELETEILDSKTLVDMFNQINHFRRHSSFIGDHFLSRNEHALLGLSMAYLLCSDRESCFQFSGLLDILLDVTRYTIGCEAFLGWWPREDESIPSGFSEGYCHLLELILSKPRHEVAPLETYLLHRLIFYGCASRYESAVLSVLGSTSTFGRVTNVTLNMLSSAEVPLPRNLPNRVLILHMNSITAHAMVQACWPVLTLWLQKKKIAEWFKGYDF
ncbi:hypothetical protein KIW84_021694 [Lathyrus oleraceus]|uniref:Uncharacterized protein n=1 Tax=Pisum sativum TaxID=3888 RepID=A0A9D5B5P6_PEA|nr:hypothetical protein KIW84_021694 [Pisum sativum]